MKLLKSSRYGKKKMLFHDAYRYLMILYARIHFYLQGYRNGGLPCWYCIFAREKDDKGSYPLWITCTNPEYGGVLDDGCNWGNT
jgi:hypothetical protein